LKQKLQYEEDLTRIWLYFMDHFAEVGEFMALGEEARHPLVEAVVAQIGQQLFGADGAVSRLLLNQIAEQDFIHGGFALGGRLGGVIYFDDLRMGLLMVTDHPPSIEVKYARFSGRPLPKRGEPSRN
jgi:hypothetical protein